MNCSTESSLKCYTSLDQFTNKFVDYGNLYVLTLTSLFGLVTNSLCILIVGFLDKRDLMNAFMMAYSILNFEFHFINIFVGLIRYAKSNL